MEREILYYVAGSCLRKISKVLPSPLWEKLQCSAYSSANSVPARWVQLMDRGGLLYPTSEFFDFIKQIWTKLELSCSIKEKFILHSDKEDIVTKDRNLF